MNLKAKVKNFLFRNKSLILKGLFIFFVSICFSPIFATVNDPDYFWHYKAGESIALTKSVPKIDPYSFSYPDFKWVNHEWLSDLFMYQTEYHFTTLGLSLLYLFLLALLAFTFIRKRKFSLVDAGIIIFALGGINGYFGVREQMFSFLCFSIFFSLVRERKYYFLPLLFLIWANLHAGFSLGIFVLFAFFGIKTLKYLFSKEKFEFKKLAIAALLSVGATLINPFGYRIYEEVIRTVGDSYLTSHIFEWMPITTFFNIRYAFYLSLFFGLMLALKKRIPLELSLIYSFLLLLSLRSIKYIPFFVIATLPEILLMVDDLRGKYTFTKDDFVKLIKTPFTLGVAAILFFYFNPDLFTNKVYADGYPTKTVNYLAALKDKNIFNKYGWGGYFIRYAPQNRYFIDGRMPSWRDKNNYPFRDYSDVMNCENIDENLQKYKIDLFVIPKKSACGLPEELKKRNWQEKYSDETAIILGK